MPYFYYDGKKIDYYHVMNPDGEITQIAKNVRYRGTHRVLGDEYTDLDEVKSRIISEWSRQFYDEDDVRRDEKKIEFIENLNNYLSHSPNQLQTANRLLHHMLLDINLDDQPEGAQRVIERRIADTRSEVDTTYDHSGSRWFAGHSMRDANIPTTWNPNDDTIIQLNNDLEGDIISRILASLSVEERQNIQNAQTATRNPPPDPDTIDLERTLELLNMY